MADEWRPVVGYEGLYSVSNEGQIRSEDRTMQTSRGPWRYRGRPLNPMVTKGHMIVTLTDSSTQRRRKQVHRLVLEAFVGPCPEGLEGCHRDDIGMNNHLENLYWGTPSQNMHDRVRNGRHPNANKTDCLRGHPLRGRNLLPAKTRQCKICSRSHSWRRRGLNFEVALKHWEEVYLDG